MNAPRPQYRKVGEMTAQELLAELGTTPQRQKDIFVKLGGDPSDHDYAYLSFLTKQLREAGYDVQSSRRHGIWLGSGEAQTPPPAESP